ncbi:hypothetical protein QBC34DRAFT_459422 [Podospora aff. communis PSN243]|uniref:Heterokaryon incompatibility domain-containing protein n=1 Tax=Podospora aff. communis PSN243 TaxID=3040156 RepID=A0AAV9GUB1_9PEZI|nr:hypothetical protein QBC34DRAFT_459422 [Podospora aff. communis PSN243]
MATDCSVCNGFRPRARMLWVDFTCDMETLSAIISQGCRICASIQEGISYFEKFVGGASNISIFNVRGAKWQQGYNGPMDVVICPKNGEPPLSLEFFAGRDSGGATTTVFSNGQRIRSRIPTDTSHEDSFQWASRVIQSCVDTHRTCNISPKREYPTRILDLGLDSNSHDGMSVRLIKIEASAPARTPPLSRYACLSHRWGQSRSLKTEKHTLESHAAVFRGTRFRAPTKTRFILLEDLDCGICGSTRSASSRMTKENGAAKLSGWQPYTGMLSSPSPQPALTAITWASVNGEVRFWDYPLVDESFRVTVAVTDVAAYTDCFGESTGGHIAVSGYLCPATLRYEQSPAATSSVQHGEFRLKFSGSEDDLDMYADYCFADAGPGHIERGALVYCFGHFVNNEYGRDHHASMVIREKVAMDGSTSYERIGIANLRIISLSHLSRGRVTGLDTAELDLITSSSRYVTLTLV